MSSTDQPGPGSSGSSDADGSAPGQLTNEQRRADAKRKLETRLDTQQRAARRRRVIVIATSATVVVAVVIAGAVVGTIKYLDARERARYTSCAYTPTPADANPFNQLPPIAPNLPPDQRALAQEFVGQYTAGKSKQRTAAVPKDRQLKSGDIDVTMTTSQGRLPITLTRSDAPCNVAAIASLISAKYYDNSPCHRLTEGGQNKIAVLQCGDPTGTGAGAPGWSSPDEFPTDLKAVPQDPQLASLGVPEQVVYPRGTVAIANSYQPGQGGQASGQNTGSAQMFMVIQDSQLPPNYSVVGTIDPAGLAVLDNVLKGGVNPGIRPSQNPNTGEIAYARSPGDGAPKLPVTIERATIS